jgi:hypothetical protein
MSLRLARRLGDAISVLDPMADALQTLVRSVPKPARDVLDGVWFGAPLHPALTDIPIGSWTASTICDAAGLDEPADAALVIGVLAAVPAALTGMNDWSHLRGDSKRVGTLHALLNTTGLALNVASVVCRRRGDRATGRALSAAA